MSYTIIIGEAIFVPWDITDDEGNVVGADLEVEAKRIENKNAPYFSDSEYTNVRSPGYSQMSEWCRLAGQEVYDMFFDKQSGLLVPHPGCRRLEKQHKKVINKALNRYSKDYPAAKPQMDNERSGTYEQDCVLARLVWYSWWFDWALNNCEFPVVSNS